MSTVQVSRHWYVSFKTADNLLKLNLKRDFNHHSETKIIKSIMSCSKCNDKNLKISLTRGLLFIGEKIIFQKSGSETFAVCTNFMQNKTKYTMEPKSE